MTTRQRVNKQIQKEFQKTLTEQYQDILFFYKKKTWSMNMLIIQECCEFFYITLLRKCFFLINTIFFRFQNIYERNRIAVVVVILT